MPVELISEIRQKNNGLFALVDANNVRGGIYSVKTPALRDSIPEDRRKTGMLCYVSSEDKYYKYTNDEWTEAIFGSDGIPIYDQEMLELVQQLPDKYITIPDKNNDLSVSTDSREITLSGTYVDILFSAIRKLLSEVAKIRNSFLYGMYSYTGKDTAMSRQVKGMTLPEEEPLWSIEEEDLSLLYSEVIGLGNTLTPVESVDVGTEGILGITGTVTWEQPLEAEDPKVIGFITSSDLNIDIYFSDDYHINLNTLDTPAVDLYNIMVCVNRQEDSNYIYISIGNGQRSQILNEGYLNNNGRLQSSPYYILDEYNILKILFTDLQLSKLNIYSKYQDFSKQVIPSMPTDEDYKYRVAHLTVRSVKDKDELESIKDQLPENELIFIEKTASLCIKNNYSLINIGSGGSGSEDDMKESDVIDILKRNGIISLKQEKGDDGMTYYSDLQINDIADLTFIHQDTGKKYKVSVDGSGNIISKPVADSDKLLASRIKSSGLNLQSNIRGFIGSLKTLENNLNIQQDVGLSADRLKIGAFYAPFKSDTIFGCNRAFIELENTSDDDFELEGCYLHVTMPDENKNQVVYHLALTGCIKGGSTYLIVGKEYTDIDDANVYILVDSFDQEWYVNGELIDLSMNSDGGYGIALTYGNESLLYTDSLYQTTTDDLIKSLGINISSISSFPYIYDKSFIDAIYYNKLVANKSGAGYWAPIAVKMKSNSMYKNMFELDPAKQAFQALTTADSSRNRWKSDNDIWVLSLNKPEISFPHSDEIYSVSHFQPKASFEDKNVSTDKSKLDKERPNMVTCSFGKDIYTVRCFNWISVGYHDEAVFLRKKGDTEWQRFDSYSEDDQNMGTVSTYPRRKAYSNDFINSIYKRITGKFPGDNTFYTAHKCVIELDSSNTEQVWEYKVGRIDKNGNPDTLHTSDILTFTIYSNNYTPVIYQITDQQGFHWVEYQVWAAAANKLYEKIQADKETASSDANVLGIIPILINTGDMTQNGTRINEWYDYYNAGKVLFKEIEQMNVVGNNDLCGTNVSLLGTGDDQGKSNSFYFHVFYCYDIDEEVFSPIVNGKYIPSLYYFDSADYRFVMVNSEITKVNCQDWFNLKKDDKPVNIYTGFTIDTNQEYVTLLDSGETLTPVYTMVYNMFNTAGDKQVITACHEMPFTVITNASIKNGTQGVSRSVTGTSLVGSHLNLIVSTETGKGLYWFSRLMETFHVKLCIGGHKHTYSCTYPIREYFKFGDGKNSKDNFGEYSMTNSLQNDDAVWVDGDKNLTKFPLTKRAAISDTPDGIFYPCTADPDLEGGVTYFMCQATGYKLTSNKELPSANLLFSMAVPLTTSNPSGDKPNKNQKYPMFGVIRLSDTYDILLVRIKNILDSNNTFSQYNYSTGDMALEWFKSSLDNIYGSWVTNETNLTQL